MMNDGRGSTIPAVIYIEKDKKIQMTSPALILNKIDQIENKVFQEEQNTINARLTFATQLLVLIAVINILIIGLKYFFDYIIQYEKTIALVYFSMMFSFLFIFIWFVSKNEPKDKK